MVFKAYLRQLKEKMQDTSSVFSTTLQKNMGVNVPANNWILTCNVAGSTGDPHFEIENKKKKTTDDTS